MKPEEILPMGYSLESILLHLMNENYMVNLMTKDSQSFLISEHFITKVFSFPRR